MIFDLILLEIKAIFCFIFERISKITLKILLSISECILMFTVTRRMPSNCS